MVCGCDKGRYPFEWAITRGVRIKMRATGSDAIRPEPRMEACRRIRCIQPFLFEFVRNFHLYTHELGGQGARLPMNQVLEDG